MFKKALTFLRKTFLGAAVACLVAVLSISSNANAAIDLTGVALDLSPAETIMGLIIAAYASIWGWKKIVKTLNRS